MRGHTFFSKTFILILSSFFLAGACTWSSHEANIYIAQPTVQPNIANGQEIIFTILDDRDETSIGNRGVGRVGAKVSAQDPVGQIERIIRQGLLEKGYILTSIYGENTKQLLVRVRALNFHHEMGFWSGSENTTVVIAAEAENGNLDYRQTYRYSNEDKAVFVAGGKEIDDHLNAGLNLVVSELLNDRALDQFLLATD